MIQINYNDARPIYEKLKDSLRRLILSGALEADSKLPSVRELAVSLSINPNTIQRAYRELELSGYIYCVAGKGNFVAGRHDVDAGRAQALLALLRETAKELRYLGMDDEQIAAYLKGGAPND